MIIKRRNFIQWGTLATGSMLVPGFLRAIEKTGARPRNARVLVVIQLSGGNDGLNTVIPVRNDIYYRERPRLGITREIALALDGETGLHPSLPGLASLYHDGDLAILNSVGYPNPDRSHFRSMDIWQTASDSNVNLSSGWLGRYLDARCHHCAYPTQAVEIDDVLSLALKGEESCGMAFRDPSRLYRTSREPYFMDQVAMHKVASGNDSLDFLYKTMAETISSADYIYEQSRLRLNGKTYPSTQLGQKLKTIASLILSEINTRVYYVSIGSFDTHVAQEGQQKRLFNELDQALGVFISDLKDHGWFEETLIFTFSEFGRRVSQNASGGTDHGTANNMFLISGGLKHKGLLNSLPDLSDLKDGDLKFQVDFRDVYATILKQWLDTDDRSILGRQSRYLDFI